MKAGDIPDYPLISEYNPPPWEFPRLAFWIVAVGLPLVVLSIAVVAYAEYAFPHGPEVFVGYEELCDGEGKCNEVEVFVEDTSGLNNPIWVNELRDWSRGVWLVAILAIVVVGWQAWGVWKWWKPRRGLVWPHSPDSWVAEASRIRVAYESNEGSSPTPWATLLSDMEQRLPKILSEWNYLNAVGRLLYGFGYYDDAAWALEMAKRMDQPDTPAHAHLYQDDWDRTLRQIEDWHDANLAYLKAHGNT